MSLFRRASILWNERKVIWNLTVRNLKIKYKDTWLGFFWAFLQPLCTILILYFVFSQVLDVGVENFPIYLCTGVIPWTFFSNAVSDATGSLIDNSNLVHKVNFPTEVIPLSYCLLSLFDFLISLVILFPVLLLFRVPLEWHLFVWLVPILFFHLIFCIGFSFFLSAVNVFYKDTAHLLGVVMMFWFYLTPVFYSIEHLSETMRFWFQFNPMLHFVDAYRAVLFHVQTPATFTLVVISVVGVVMFFSGWTYFVNREKEMVKEL